MPETISVKLDMRRLDALARDLDVKADRIVAAMALEVEGNAKASFGTGPAGRTYRHGSVTHIASAPGYPPAVDTGTLRTSVHNWKIAEAMYGIGDGVSYGSYLEFGTPFMAARPWLYPAVFKMEQDFAQRFGDLFK